jgi:DNA-binding transcriptional MerR regulator
MKRAGGRRFYRPQDIAVLSGVRALLHAEGYTIKGVQKLHREQGLTHVIAAGLGDNGSASLEGLAAAVDSPSHGELADEARGRLVLALDDLQAVKARLDGLLRGA